ncbi:agmatine deiminase family protein [Opitutia bacterium ISCC 51]|nr:agmatine deiminase family protein [Opitutae bacterium ISCC 51]QXD28335.1 agmatine deiminase family protein [Opitutae bacterium ISCC 52]
MKSSQNLGYRLPAELEPQEAVWLSWPSNPASWPHCWDAIHPKFAEIALVLSRSQSVYINLVSELQSEAESILGKVGADLGLARGDIQFFDHPVNHVWVRDYGPIYLRGEEDGAVALTNWNFNGWGEKYPFELDNQVPALVARQTDLPCFEQSLILEGGSIETNGQGDLLVTTNCLLNPNRNPDCSRDEIETQLKSGLGVDKVHWLDGCIEGDDTDGHIDNLVRFFKPIGVLVASGSSRDDPNFDALVRLEQQCRELTFSNGDPVEVRLVPLPESRFQGERRLPMSYVNFFVANQVVIMPSYGQVASDAHAHNIVSDAFPDREGVSIDCQEVIQDGGALHCLTQQVPQTQQ